MPIREPQHGSTHDDSDCSRPKPEDVKEVYARFGLAYYLAEVLYRGLCNLYCGLQAPQAGPVTRCRVEEHLRTASELTLGQLLPRLQTILPPSLLRRLSGALERRNFIAHHFWFERIHLMATSTGIESMIAELAQHTEVFQELDKEIDQIIEPYYARMGLTPELLAVAFNEIKSGKAGALDPLPAQRLPWKQETVIKVFDVPTASGHAVLVFQTDDGLLWQLCDAGLGWSPYNKVDPSWPLAHKFIELLPAKVNPRPTASAPWTFEIPFGAHAALVVRPGKRAGQVVYQLHMRGRAVLATKVRKSPHE